MQALLTLHMNINGIDKTLRKRWFIWTSLILVYIVGYFHRVAPAVIAEDLMRAFQTSGVLLGVLSSVYFYTYAAMQIPAGILSDTLGPRDKPEISHIYPTDKPEMSHYYKDWLISGLPLVYFYNKSFLYLYKGR